MKIFQIIIIQALHSHLRSNKRNNGCKPGKFKEQAK